LDLSMYLRTVRRFWYLPLAFLLLSLAGAYVYHHKLDTQVAQATVAVLDPLVARPGVYSEAEVTFDSVIKSRKLAAMVGQRLHRTTDDIAGRLSVTIIPTLAAINPSPVYAVRASDRDPNRALQLANVATEQGRVLYIQLNQPDPQAALLAMQPQVDLAKAQSDKAQADLNTFNAAHDTYDLTARVAKQRDVVAGFQGQLHQTDADLAAIGNTNSSGRQALLRREASLRQSEATENQGLARLIGLQTQFNDLSIAAAAALQHYTQVQQMQQNIADGERTLPLTADVKLVDEARIQSQLLFKLLTYAMALLLGASAGASAIYLLALFAQQPETAERVATAFGAPVLVRIPR
jgi:hypothetical protein